MTALFVAAQDMADWPLAFVIVGVAVCIAAVRIVHWFTYSKNYPNGEPKEGE